MIVLGLNHGEINSSAAIVKDGQLLAAAPEERFNRQKFTKVFPAEAVKFCLKELGINLQGCDYVAQAWNPTAHQNVFNPFISGNRIRREDYFYSISDNLFNSTERKPGDWVLMNYPEETGLPPIYFIQHHRTHAANAFYLSPYENAAILTADFRGEFETITMCKGEGNKIKVLQTLEIPHSLGMVYAAYTQLLGYKPDNDEWKVMALSAYDIDCEKEYNFIRSTIHLTDDGLFTLDQDYYKGALITQPNLYTQKLRDGLGGRVGKKGETPEEWHIKIAKAMQRVSEEVSIHMLKHLHKITGCDNVVVSGGFFMNSVFNGKITAVTPFKKVFIPYAPTDAGNSIGAALYVAHHIHNEARVYRENPSHIGPGFSNEEIETVLKRRKIKYTKTDNKAKAVAALLAKGNIVSFFNGKMEFGDRALGCRSILGDPRDASMKDKINAVIKYREAYRPFAPSILSDRAEEFFEVEEGFSCDYMEKVVPFKEEKKSLVPAVVHFDGSGRVQTVQKKSNPDYYNIIAEFEKLTGVPVVLNTSFNINGEPVVLTPDDALNTFFNSGLEHLFLSDYYVAK